ncbi:MAG: glycosyltransferase [Acetobacter sp.]
MLAMTPSEKPSSSSKQAHLESLLESYQASMTVQDMRMGGFLNETQHLRHLVENQRNTLSWRITAPLRVIRHLSKGQLPTGDKITYVLGKIWTVYHEEGFKALWSRIQARLPRKPKASRSRHEASPVEKFTSKLDISEKIETIEDQYLRPVSAHSVSDFSPSYLIIAELSLRQCAKYRVWQKQEQLESLGWHVRVVDWRETFVALTALQTCTNVIFYRVPAFESVEKLLNEAKRLNLPTCWEVDDLIFSEDHYKNNANLDSLSSSEREMVFSGVKLFRNCLLSCDKAIASTRILAQEMRNAGVNEVSVIENAIDEQTLSISNQIFQEHSTLDHGAEEIRIVYGSGTKTHDADFLVAADGIVAAMLEDERLTLHIIGDLTVPEVCNKVKSRIKTLEGRDYALYMRLLAQADITISPLEKTIFNDCKSNIKFLEAAVLSVPVICSPADAFMQVVRDGENAMIARTPQDWKNAILSLASDNAKRKAMGRAAYQDALDRYSPENITQQQILPVFGKPEHKKKPDLSVVSVNVYFAPRSFGGATFVAEEMVKYLTQKPDITVSVFTSRPDMEWRANAAIRYRVYDCNVMGVRVPPDGDRVAGIDNPLATESFRQWLHTVRPDIVHLHATQGLGLGLTRACLEAGIPYVITLHDAWWLCDRQFMVTGEGNFCFQNKIDLRICQMCEPSARHLHERATMMRVALRNAALLLVPSQSHKNLFIANGIPEEKFVVNRNGFVWPAKPRVPRKPGQPLRFGYVGGAETVKGYPLIRKVFEHLKTGRWELMLVDNKLSLGIRSVFPEAWKVKGVIKTVPAYTQSTMDNFYNGIDVLLFPSQCKESYGLTVREALARDIWVVVTEPGGQVEDVVEGENGTIIPIGSNPIHLQKAVEDLLSKEAALLTYENPHKDRLATFDMQGRELEEILRTIVGEYAQAD